MELISNKLTLQQRHYPGLSHGSLKMKEQGRRVSQRDVVEE